jgi:hypothetical protein
MKAQGDFIKSAIPDINKNNVTLITDRDKGLYTEIQFSQSLIEHNTANILPKMFRNTLVLIVVFFFWKIVRERTELRFHQALDEVHNIKPTTANFGRNIPRQTYAIAFFPSQRHGHLPLKIVQPSNNVFLRRENSRI